MSKVLLNTHLDWSNSKKALPKELHPCILFCCKLQMTTQRVVIPFTLQQQVLKEIYEGHMGIVRMKSLARMHV